MTLLVDGDAGRSVDGEMGGEGSGATWLPLRMVGMLLVLLPFSEEERWKEG